MHTQWAYSAPLPPQSHAALGAWVLDPLTTTVLAITAVGVVLGASRARRIGWAPWRAVLVALGLGVAVITVDGWPALYARGLDSVLVIQDLALLLVIPLLLVFGQLSRPLAMVLGGRRPPRPVLAAARLVGHPLVGPLLVPAVLALLFFTPLANAVVDHRVAADVVHVGLLGVGIAVAAPLATAGSMSSLGYGLIMFVGLVELLVDAIPGIALRLEPRAFTAAHTLASRRNWGPSPLHDQQLAGAILWALAEIIDVPFLLIVLRQWMRADAAEAADIDRAMDRAERAAALRRPVTVAEATGTAPAPPPLLNRPWWETDAGVFGDHRTGSFRAAARRRSRTQPPPDGG